MVLRSIGSGICVVALLLTSCATSGGLPSVALDFFIPASAENPWNHKIENWQLRHQLDPVVRGADSEAATDLGDAYISFTDKLRRQIALQTVQWVQKNSREFYRPDGAQDHWATLSEVIETGGDDCDGLDLLTFVLLRRMGFGENEIFRSIVVEEGTGQHHMVTLWFENGTNADPYVLDPTGVVTQSMSRLSEVGAWEPIELFNERAHFAVKPRLDSSGSVAYAD
jgi:hypothetical protein